MVCPYNTIKKQKIKQMFARYIDIECMFVYYGCIGTNVRSEVFGMEKRNGKRRMRLVNRKRFVTVVVTFVMIIMASVSVIGSAISVDAPPQYTKLVVKHGDTLWSIASEYGPSNMDIREYINEIEKVNVIENSFLAEGRELLLPDLN